MAILAWSGQRVDHSRTWAAVILVDGFAAISAVCGGVMVITGWPYQFPDSWLDGTPFPNYLVPGLILGLVVGGTALFATVESLKRASTGARASIVAGVIMMGWIVGEIILLKVGGFTWLWPLYFAVGLTMAGLGLRLAR